MAVRAVLNDAGQGHAKVLVCLQILNKNLACVPEASHGTQRIIQAIHERWHLAIYIYIQLDASLQWGSV